MLLVVTKYYLNDTMGIHLAVLRMYPNNAPLTFAHLINKVNGFFSCLEPVFKSFLIWLVVIIALFCGRIGVKCLEVTLGGGDKHLDSSLPQIFYFKQVIDNLCCAKCFFVGLYRPKSFRVRFREVNDFMKRLLKFC